MSKIFKGKNQSSKSYKSNYNTPSRSQGTFGKSLISEGGQSIRSSSRNDYSGYLRDSVLTHQRTVKKVQDSRLLQSEIQEDGIERKTQVLDPLDKTVVKLDTAHTQLNRPDLLRLYDKFGVFPNKHRPLIWKFLLELPGNQEVFERYLNCGIHPAFADIPQEYKIASKSLGAKLQRILSCLAYYSPIFSEVDYLPNMIYPFVKLFANDDLICFETVIAFFLHWGQHFFEYFPNPPVSIIQSVEELLKYHELELYTYFKNIGLNMVDYVWPFLKSLFTTIINKDDWLSLLDFIVLQNKEPQYFLLFILAYLSYFKEPLMRIKTLEEMEHFLEKQNPVNIHHIIKNMRHLKKKTPQSVLTITFKPNLPMHGKQYPIFNLFPEYSVEYHRRVREQYIFEKKKLENKKERIKQVQSLTEELLEQERKFRDKQEALVKAQNDRQNLLRAEEERRLHQRLLQETNSRDRRLEQLRNLEEAIKTSLEQQDKLAGLELQEMEKGLELQTLIDKQLIQSRLEEDQLSRLEFQVTQRLNEVTELRNKEERARKIRTEIDFIDRQNKLRDQVWDENLRAEDEEFKLKMDVMRQKKLSELNRQQEINDKKELDLKLMTEAFEKELKMKDVERERNLRMIAQEEVFRNEEFMQLYKKEEEARREEEEKIMRRRMEEEKNNLIRRADEKLTQIEHEKRLLANDITKYGNTLKERDINQKREMFEDRIIAIRREEELRLLEEEKDLQKTLLDIEEQRKFQKEMQQELLMKEREYHEKQDIYHSLKSNEDRMLHEERERFAEFREGAREELSKVEEARERMLEARLHQLRLQNEELIQKNAEETRKKIQTENMLRYYQSLRERSDDRGERSEESLRDTDQRSWESRGQEIKIEGKPYFYFMIFIID